jgi:hypothetical protein
MAEKNNHFSLFSRQPEIKPKNGELLSERERKEKIFLENLALKPTLYYDPWVAQFWIYLGEGDPTQKKTADEEWITITDQRLQEILGYVALGYIDHLTVMVAMGYNVEVYMDKKTKSCEISQDDLERLREPNKDLFPMEELVGTINYHYRNKDEEETE